MWSWPGASKVPDFSLLACSGVEPLPAGVLESDLFRAVTIEGVEVEGLTDNPEKLRVIVKEDIQEGEVFAQLLGERVTR